MDKDVIDKIRLLKQKYNTRIAILVTLILALYTWLIASKVWVKTQRKKESIWKIVYTMT